MTYSTDWSAYVPGALVETFSDAFIVAGARTPFVDQRHRSLGHAMADKECLVGGGDDIDHGVADGGHVVGDGHTGVLGQWSAPP